MIRPPTAHVLTYGCQMNNFDSEMIEERLVQMGFGFSKEWKSADLIVFNTCAIRDKSSERVFGQLGHVKTLKNEHPEKVVAVHGCMAAHEPENLRERAPFVDIFIDSNKVEDLMGAVEKAFPQLRDLYGAEAEGGEVPRPFPDETPFKRFLPIMRGCNFFCTFCVVPYVRGRERSFPVDEILGRILGMSQAGVVKEVTLLGQNVNSYKHDEMTFPQLLSRCAERFPEIKFRFMTSNPWDFSDALVSAMADHENVAKHLHLPLQSGSNEVLEAMNRTYTREQYLDMVCRLRERIPDVSLTTDIIAGFPGETLEDHQATLDLMDRVRYDSAFMFFYSEREGTPAADFDDAIPLPERRRRLREIIDLQIEHSKERNLRYLGRRERALVEGPARKSPGKVAARLDHNKTVLVEAEISEVLGSYLPVEVTATDAFTLEGICCEAL
jgi:tRNA-2-methylthio-N6-dimethylallyladenosine synthase